MSLAGKRGKDSLLDVEQIKMVRNVPARAREIPGGVAGFCDCLEPEVLTAIDCNSLHFESYGGEAYPGRLDHLVASDPRNRIYVVESGLAFVDKVRLDETQAPSPTVRNLLLLWCAPAGKQQPCLRSPGRASVNAATCHLPLWLLPPLRGPG